MSQIRLAFGISALEGHIGRLRAAAFRLFVGMLLAATLMVLLVRVELVV